MKKRKELLNLASILIFYFNETLKGIVFQFELNSFLITHLFILKMKGAESSIKVDFCVSLCLDLDKKR